VSGHDIFISYSREDRAAARHFADSFVREGFSVWWDAVLRSGETFDEVIERELKAAKAVVVLWSPRSVASRWVRAEATLADRSNKLVPAIIEKCNLPIIFELTHAAELSDWTGDTADVRWQTLASDLRRLVGEKEEEAARKAPEIPAPAVAPVPPPQANTGRNGAEVKPSPTTTDELVAALARIGEKPAKPELVEPTPAEEGHTQFYKQSDEFRLQESDKVHFLQRVDAGDQAERFVVTSTGLKIGRTLPSDLILAHAGVSREHCLVQLSGEKLRVTDLNSTNGTFIDNDRIDGSAILAVGSILRVGNVLLEHEVQTRAEFNGLSDQIGFTGKDGPPIVRAAR
jgi:TIR domain-containing protein/FHA domain-containing protein